MLDYAQQLVVYLVRMHFVSGKLGHRGLYLSFFAENSCLLHLETTPVRAVRVSHKNNKLKEVKKWSFSLMACHMIHGYIWIYTVADLKTIPSPQNMSDIWSFIFYWVDKFTDECRKNNFKQKHPNLPLSSKKHLSNFKKGAGKVIL